MELLANLWTEGRATVVSISGDCPSASGRRRWTVCRIIMLASITAAMAVPAQAQSNEWYMCVNDKLLPREALTGSVATAAVAVSVRCKALYRGPEGDDVHDAVALIEKIRAKVAARPGLKEQMLANDGPLTVSPPPLQPPPTGGKP